jgi:hypothetical protein
MLSRHSKALRLTSGKPTLSPEALLLPTAKIFGTPPPRRPITGSPSGERAAHLAVPAKCHPSASKPQAFKSAITTKRQNDRRTNWGRPAVARSKRCQPGPNPSPRSRGRVGWWVVPGGRGFVCRTSLRAPPSGVAHRLGHRKSADMDGCIGCRGSATAAAGQRIGRRPKQEDCGRTRRGA